MGVYLGWASLGLFAWAFWNRKRVRPADMAFLLSGILVFMLIASGPFLHVYGHPVVVLPTALLDYVPFMNIMRSAARAVVFVYLFLGIGAGAGLDLIVQSCRLRGRRHLLWCRSVCWSFWITIQPG
jgi:hypothetical protein